MKNNEKAIEYLEDHIPELAEAAVKQAYWQALASGSSIFGVMKEVFRSRNIENYSAKRAFCENSERADY